MCEFHLKQNGRCAYYTEKKIYLDIYIRDHVN